MRLLVQLVKSATVTVQDVSVGSIGPGLLIFFGAHVQDSVADSEQLAEKISLLRIFPDSNGKMNLSMVETGASALIVSQFTLYGDCWQGKRPSFGNAAPPALAKELYDSFVSAMKARIKTVETGVFGESMAVSLVNDGPTTFVIDSKNLHGTVKGCG